MTTGPAFWRDRRVLVTGATGLLGGWLVRDLMAQDADVVAVVRDQLSPSPLASLGPAGRLTQVPGAVEDLELMVRVVNEYAIDAVFHLAAQTIVGTALRDPISTFTSNVQGTWCVLDACRRAGTVTRIVVASTDKVYGNQPSLPYLEDAPLLGRHPYDVSKTCADLIAQTYAATYGLPIVVTRFGNLFGGGDLNWDRIIPGTIRAALRGESPVIRSDGTPVRDYVFVRNAVDAYLRLAEQADRDDVRGRVYNVSEDRPMSVVDICRKTLEASGRPELEIIVGGGARHEIQDQWLDSTRARTELAWTPKYSLEDGLVETVKWYDAYFQSVRRLPAGIA